MTAPELDHLVVGAADLDAATAALERDWGVRFGPGGQHPAMGTHNRLTRIAPASYLEIIATDPSAASPDRPRWFGLDDPAVRAELEGRPRLLGWALRVPNIEAAIAASPIDLGRATAMTRGALRWRITIRDDGTLSEGGTVPFLIEWPDGAGPAASIPDSGLRFLGLTLRHPEPARLRTILAALGAADLAAVETGTAPALAARLAGPDGRDIALG
jgi:hypothetical protein